MGIVVDPKWLSDYAAPGNLYRASAPSGEQVQIVVLDYSGIGDTSIVEFGHFAVIDSEGNAKTVTVGSLPRWFKDKLANPSEVDARVLYELVEKKFLRVRRAGLQFPGSM